MAQQTRSAVNARIVYWGPEQAGVSTTLRRLFAKLRPDHRGTLREVPTRLDPTRCYEVLPIKLGDVGGVDTRLEIIAVPGAAEHAPTRKQLLDRADGVVFVADARPERLGASLESFSELRRSLADYGRALDTIPLVVQINHCDRGSSAGLEELSRKLGAVHAPHFETIATEGTGVLQALSTISKGVVRSLRDAPAQRAGHAAPAATPRLPLGGLAPRTFPTSDAGDTWPAPVRSLRAPTTTPSPRDETATIVLDEVTSRVDPPPASRSAASVAAPPLPHAARSSPLRIASAGTATCEDGRTLRIPLEIEESDGRRRHLVLTLLLDLSEPEPHV